MLIRLLFIAAIILSLSLGCRGEEFLETHWKDPIPEQGPLPGHFSQLESQLDPVSCGTCHKEQFQKWEESLHARTISSGILWQLPGLGKKKADTCFRCHSPLTETRRYLAVNEGWEPDFPQEWETYLPKGTEKQGLVCANCHVRNHNRYGPPSRVNSVATKLTPHNGFTVKKEFESSEFCKNCHETPESGKIINGKRMMETFSEWKTSRFAKEGTSCQNCHMPGRNHEWKGIHDKEMVQNGLEVKLDIFEKDNSIFAKGMLTSKNIGHKFPSYAVPKIYIRLILDSKAKSEEPILLREETIGRFVDIFIEKESFDTRLSPGESIQIEAKLAKNQISPGSIIKLEVDVSPGEMYNRMFQHNLENKEALSLSPKAVPILEQALDEKKKSDYRLFTLSQEVLGPPRQ
ncbi:multiheme c-type cytochrome [Leptospira ilyithenensis]|uniref:Cytochrome c554 and C-prime n=1 Tax=Leptospira ilyithenensis TaxID=2484901 RepID=A0A4R9LMB7_9LEPT|nr:multiheme c-type cytochrome [Leptospira ilyithenensis]TGN07148.1 cytochrome c554 and C-prime [Leptospira ilyithenensis]